MKLGDVATRANHRIELAGDWTDLPPYCEAHGGRIINLAVNVPGLVIEVEAKGTAGSGVEFVALDSGVAEIIESSTALDDDAPLGALFLAKATFRDFLRRRGCDDLGVFLADHRGKGLRIQTNSNAPAGSGLGTSSILATLVRLALARSVGERLDNQEACWQTYEMETTLGLGSGWQDQLGGILPGIKQISYQPGDRPQIEALSPPAAFMNRFQELTVLAYTGRTRYSGNILNEVGERIRSRPETVAVLDALKEECTPMRQALLTGDWELFGGLVNRITGLQRALHPGIVTEQVSDLFAMTSHLCIGSRICGAGGEGFLLFIAKANEQREFLVQFLSRAGLRCFSMMPGNGIVLSVRN